VRLGLYKIFFRFEACVHESIIILLRPPTCIARTIAIPVHIYCAIYEPPPTSRLYAVHYTILVMATSCKGQLGPLQEILLLRGLCARINPPFIAPSTCTGHTIAILWLDYCAIDTPPPRPPFCKPFYIRRLAMAISCKDQGAPLLRDINRSIDLALYRRSP